MVSRLLRRTHMYVALFLTPWMLMYTLSTAAMNHREHLHDGPSQPRFTPEREFTYDGVFPQGAKPRDIAAQLLASLDMDGAHNVQRPNDTQRITILRQDPLTPRRITYTPADRKVAIERMEFESSAFLERMHRRRGFQHPYFLEDAWAFSVDLVIAAIVFWALSGLWMWWELKVTRKVGAICLAAGAALFALFVVTI
ncbi:MAG: PepSY-associated TM helix domain-containing protein [Bryobacterales bacterium]|nr:PepSY-associated TM helix domain-containing protein [Bryobacterales bacterium]